LGRARVDRDDDAVFVDEGEGRGAVVGLDVIDNLALEIIVLCDRGTWGGGVVTIRSRGRSNGRGGNPRNKFDVARLGASGGIAWDGWRRTFSTWGSLKFCAWTSLWISRALCGRIGWEVRRQWVSERRGDGEMAVTTRTAVSLRSQPCEGRGGGRTTHKSASILSVARCGASSTE